MKRNVLGIALLLMLVMPLQACSRKEQKINLAGQQGKIACTITLPKGFNPESDQVPMVILMHGIFASKDWVPIPSFAKELAKAGIASIRLDFNGHGKSDGRMQDMTIEKELADARAVWDYVQSLPYVSQVGLLGHSQGGVIASMTAGRLASWPDVHGVWDSVLEWAFERTRTLRVDTHRDNTIMQHNILKHGFTYCGIIYLLSGDERLAYQKTINRI